MVVGICFENIFWRFEQFFNLMKRMQLIINKFLSSNRSNRFYTTDSGCNCKILLTVSSTHSKTSASEKGCFV